ncbi:MAG: hypothetical protein LUF00_05145 [Lachnospiraceae bacterium]|nr:hypothetical protein [Lachnospiraceae bacterium]
MKKLIGLILFSTGVGMVLMLLLPLRFWVMLLMTGLLLAGYNLFCSS